MATHRIHLRTAGRRRLVLVGLLRCGVGLAALARPVDAIRFAGVDTVTAQRTAWVARLAGARDIALGAGLLDALARGEATQRWVAAGAFSDAVDAAVMGSATARGQFATLPGTAMTAAAAGGVLAVAPVTVTSGPDSPHDQT